MLEILLQASYVPDCQASDPHGFTTLIAGSVRSVKNVTPPDGDLTTLSSDTLQNLPKDPAASNLCFTRAAYSARGQDLPGPELQDGTGYTASLSRSLTLICLPQFSLSNAMVPRIGLMLLLT